MNNGSWRSRAKGIVDKDIIDQLIARNKLRKMDMSKTLYGGDCPFCGQEKCFMIWSEKGSYRCFLCGCDGRFVPSPERLLEKPKQEGAPIEDMAG